MPEKKNSPVQQQVMKRMQKKSLASPHGAMSGRWAGEVVSFVFLEAACCWACSSFQHLQWQRKWGDCLWSGRSYIQCPLSFTFPFFPPPLPPPPQLKNRSCPPQANPSKHSSWPFRSHLRLVFQFLALFRLHFSSKVRGTVCRTLSQATSSHRRTSLISEQTPTVSDLTLR